VPVLSCTVAELCAGDRSRADFEGELSALRIKPPQATAIAAATTGRRIFIQAI